MRITEAAEKFLLKMMKESNNEVLVLETKVDEEGYFGISVSIKTKEEAPEFEEIDGVLVSCSKEDLERLEGFIFDVEDGGLVIIDTNHHGECGCGCHGHHGEEHEDGECCGHHHHHEDGECCGNHHHEDGECCGHHHHDEEEGECCCGHHHHED